VSTPVLATYASALRPHLDPASRVALAPYLSSPPESFPTELARAFLAVHTSLGFALQSLAPSVLSPATTQILASMPLADATQALVAHHAIASLLYAPSPGFPLLTASPAPPFQSLYWVDSAALILHHAAAHAQDPHFAAFCDTSLHLAATMAASATLASKVPFPAVLPLLQEMQSLSEDLEVASL
jgi:hypothetical protein